MEEQKAILLLEDGTAFKGRRVGALGTTTGEIAFNTGMTGYQEVFTDPSYHGQILVLATSHIGNYGVSAEDVESENVKISGAVVKSFSKTYSRASADQSLQDYFERDSIVAISDIDTRALVRHIRDKGAMNAIISSEEFDLDKLTAQLKAVPSMQGLELSSKVSTPVPYMRGEGGRYRVALYDFGVKTSIFRNLSDRDCEVKVFPMNTPFEDVKAYNPDGIMLSNGPGDPSVMKQSVELVGEIIKSGIPTFGICLGHQLIALSQGLSTQKMHSGHRGINHPVKNLETGKCEVTSQNHGFVVNREEAEKHPNIKVTHVHLNDHTLAGFRLVDQPVFSVQFHPEAAPGPNDSKYLFDDFIQAMQGVSASVANA